MNVHAPAEMVFRPTYWIRSARYFISGPGPDSSRTTHFYFDLIDAGRIGHAPVTLLRTSLGDYTKYEQNNVVQQTKPPFFPNQRDPWAFVAEEERKSQESLSRRNGLNKAPTGWHSATVPVTNDGVCAFYAMSGEQRAPNEGSTTVSAYGANWIEAVYDCDEGEQRRRTEEERDREIADRSEETSGDVNRYEPIAFITSVIIEKSAGAISGHGKRKDNRRKLRSGIDRPDRLVDLSANVRFIDRSLVGLLKRMLARGYTPGYVTN
ncbi:hypothetical protein EAG_11222 [Camponotus floridanus]|uniref:Uncharacterized protein n=1 Tax=Camponotus floridanus TaxID=104421 RepID=E2A0M8_CAMFO|nr:hypothetical protein EAG_11222 [Camponotus floridanus]